MTCRGELRIGTCGYQYEHWRRRFYPEGLPKSRWFEHYARHFDTVEINNTFYHLPSAQAFEQWRERAPAGFLYALKFSRYATHVKRLKDPQEPIARFLEHAERLGPFLGPVLVQLPPGFRVAAERLTRFLEAAPRGIRWVLEFRHRSWLCEEIYALLEAHGAMLCIHDLIADHPVRTHGTGVYLRFHGQRYKGSYSPQYLSAQARRIRRWREDGLDVWVYFNNDERGYAVDNAIALKRYLDLR